MLSFNRKFEHIRDKFAMILHQETGKTDNFDFIIEM